MMLACVTAWDFTASDTTFGTTSRDLAGREHQAAAKVQPVQLDTRFSFNNYTVRRQLILTPAAVCKSKPACYELLHSLAQLSSELQRTGAEHASQPTGIFATGSMSR
ncbi:hypothetical protein WJX79_004302 [Trebouxia sp. C0005]